MILQQVMTNDELSPHTPSPLTADADATVTGTDIICLADLQPQPGEWLWQHRLAGECSAALRTEFLVGSSPDAPAQTALLHVKSNLGPLAPPLDYQVGQGGNFHWAGLSNIIPEDLLAARPTGAGLPKRKFAAQWLRDCLQPGSQTQGSIENSISAFVAPNTENQVPGGGLCLLRRISDLRSTRQDAQINYLSTLSIFMKQTTYLATLPNPNLKANECHCFRTLKGRH
jgi:hypothetical protein